MEPALGAPSVPPVRWLRRLSLPAFARLMGAAIERVLRTEAGLGEGVARALRRQVLAAFASELMARTRPVRALTKSECLAELERTHGALLRERLGQVEELRLLEREVGRVRAGGAPSVPSPASASELTLALEAELRALLGPGREGELADLLARERARRDAAFEAEARRTAERIDLLERRLAKLRAILAESERALIELARRAELDPGLPSIYRTVQGLLAEEPGRVAKLGMLKQVYEANLVLQRRSG
ncbi:MAG TPA: hypothetical protein VF530_15980 [Planctomycetota bacterium]